MILYYFGSGDTATPTEFAKDYIATQVIMAAQDWMNEARSEHTEMTFQERERVSDAIEKQAERVFKMLTGGPYGAIEFFPKLSKAQEAQRLRKMAARLEKKKK